MFINWTLDSCVPVIHDIRDAMRASSNENDRVSESTSEIFTAHIHPNSWASTTLSVMESFETISRSTTAIRR